MRLFQSRCRSGLCSLADIWWLIIAGIIILVVGAALQFAPWLFTWFGKLPGDIRVESGSVKIFVPITSMLLLSIALTLLLSLLNR